MASHLVTAMVQVKRKADRTAKVVVTKTVSVLIRDHVLVATTKAAQTVRVHKVKAVLKDKANQRVNANLSAVNSIELEQ